MGFFRDKAKDALKRVLQRDSTPPREAPPPPDTTAPEPTAEEFSSMECEAQELKERLDAGEDVLVVDVREARELPSGILENAIHIPMRELTTRWKEVAQANEIVCYCQSGARSYESALFLRSQGLFNATSLEGGINAWRAIGGKTVNPS